MPIYDYTCDKCNKEFEISLKSIKDYDSNRKIICPYCDLTTHTRRIFKSTSFHLKGSCWARDHYGKKPLKGEK